MRFDGNKTVESLCADAIAGDEQAIDRLWETIEPLLKRSIGGRFGRLPAEWIHDASPEERSRGVKADPQHADARRGGDGR